MYTPTILGDGCQVPPLGPIYVLLPVPPQEVVTVAKRSALFSFESRKIEFFRLENALAIDFHEGLDFGEISRLSTATVKDIIVRNKLPAGAEFFARYVSREEGEGEYFVRD